MNQQIFSYHATITGHEHLNDFGLINMNGRMYDPLKYVDPSGEQCFGWNGGNYYRMIEAIQQQVSHEWYSVYDAAVASVQLTINMACRNMSN